MVFNRQYSTIVKNRQDIKDSTESVSTALLVGEKTKVCIQIHDSYLFGFDGHCQPMSNNTYISIIVRIKR
jgi:hypothetical protein